MSIEAIDHLYVETASFDGALAFWEGLGFRLTQRWGNAGHQAGRLEAGAAVVVLAEGPTPGIIVHFRIGDATEYARRLESAGAVTISQRLAPTHWGSALLRATDPDGHVFALEEPAPAR